MPNPAMLLRRRGAAGRKPSAPGPAFISATTAVSAAANSIVCGAPASIVSGNRLIAIASCGNTGGAWTPPSGFTQLVALATAGMSGAVFAKVATGSEPGTYTFNVGGSAQPLNAVVLQYAASAVDGTPVQASNAGGSATTSCPLPSATSTLAPDTQIACWMTNNFPGAGNLVLPGGFTQRAAQGIIGDCQMLVADCNLPSVGPSVAGTATGLAFGTFYYDTVTLLH